MTSLNTKIDDQDVAVSIEGDIVRYKMADLIDDEKIIRLINVGTQILDEDISSLILVDLNGVQKFSLGARGYWTQFFKNPQIKKIAIFGGDQFVKTIISFVTSSLPDGKAQFFSTENEALSWLKL